MTSNVIRSIVILLLSAMLGAACAALVVVGYWLHGYDLSQRGPVLRECYAVAVWVFGSVAMVSAINLFALNGCSGLFDETKGE